MARPRKRLAFGLIALTGSLALFRADSARAEGDVWDRLTPMPTPRRLLAAATYDGKIYTFGGCGSPCFEPPLHTSTDEETRVQVYYPGEDVPGGDHWEERQRMSAILFGAAAATVDDKIYTFGGFVTPTLTQEYDPVSDSWRNRKPMPTPRHGLAAVAFGGKVYVLGGSDGKNPSAALEIYDPKENTWTPGPHMPTARVFLAAAEVGGKIFAIGGSPDCCGKSQTTAVEIYDPKQKTWTIGDSLPIALQTSAAASVKGKIYVFGGFVPGSGVRDTTFEYDPNAAPGVGPWSFKRDMPTARDQAPAAAVMNGDIYVLGGAVDCHCSPLEKNERYRPEMSEIPPRLKCTKSGPTSVTAGGLVSYTVMVTNIGGKAATGVTLHDPTPEGVNFHRSPGSLCGEGFPCSLGTIEAGGSRGPVEVTFEVPGKCSSPPGSIENVARVRIQGVVAAVCKADPTVVIVPPKPDVEISITGPTEVHQTETATYSVVVTNTGAAVSGVVVRVTIVGGKALPSPPCVVDPGIDPQGFTCDLGSLSAGSPPITRALNVEPPQGCPCPSQPITLNASVTATEEECNEDNNTASATTAVKCEADLAIYKSAPAFVKKDESIPYVLKIINKGPDYACGVKVKDSYIDDIGISKHPKGCDEKPAVGGICPGGSFQAMYFLEQHEPCGAEIPNTAIITADTFDPDTSNNSDTVMTTVVCPPVSRCITPPVLRLKE